MLCVGSFQDAILPGTQDATFEFEKRRNRPVRYDRQLVGNTIRAIKQVENIQKKREERFWSKRMAGKKNLEKKQDAIEVEKSMKLITPAERKEVENKVAEQKEKKTEEKPQTIKKSTGSKKKNTKKQTDVSMD
eukprot:gb/GECG01014591.1/.p1 GENE.gb/GECG01014591.1/~~gb/GECG01014591.1/.p1  ORF type:complete len:133 (+),score=29.01 gb/GECG01014591.1/:1-399(+)